MLLTDAGLGLRDSALTYVKGEIMTIDVELEQMVRELYDKQAIWEVMANFSRGLDRRDRDILLSCYHPDALDDHGAFVGGAADFFDWAGPSHLDFMRTHQHILSNHTCTRDGDTAHTETYWTFAGMMENDDTLAMFGGRYLDRLEKRNGEWRIAARKCLLEWWGTPSNEMMTEETVAAFSKVGKVAKDGSDSSYERPLTVDSKRVGVRASTPFE